jgi:hypothetical protein
MIWPGANAAETAIPAPIGARQRPVDNEGMTRASDDDKKRKKTSRLAAALRENLRRRKAQERQRGALKPSKEG